MSELSLSLLGSFVASLDDRALTHFRAKTVQALLLYLVCQPEAHQREQLMTLLWPGMPQPSAQQSLRQSLYLLRQAIPELPTKNGNGVVPLLLADRQMVQVNPDGRYHLDVHTFSHLLKQDEAYWPEAVALYRGDFLADFYLPDSAPFEEWVNARRAELQRQMLKALEKLTQLALQQAAFETAEAYARRQLEIDNLRESAQRQLMEALARHGRRVDALTEYETLAQRLQTELGVTPSPETQALYEAIQKNELVTGWQADKVTTLQPAASPPPISSSPRHNLPRPLTSFIGREKEITHVQKLLLNPEIRLVTLTGPGGTGKTRLSLEAARTLVAAFADGIWLVELAPLADPALVTAAVATVFELREEGGRPLATVLAGYLRAKQLLLILDNCEHLIESCARLAESWLETCPNLTILASSREALGVPGELAVRILPLAVPDPQETPPLETLAQVEAVQLFVERARAVLPDFSLTVGNGTAVTQVCQRLDGIPLAIELAAARVKVLQVEQVAQRLDDRFRLLTGGSRTALPRQQTLRATIDWSYDLLSEVEQRLLQRLSVFAGGWTLEAAEAVCADEKEEMRSEKGEILISHFSFLSSFEILDLLTQLVNKSLVIAERMPGQETRYRLLETIRQYAQEKLFQAGVGETFRRRHLEFFLQLAETAEPELHRTNQLLWLDRLEAEHDNLRAALAWSLENPNGDVESGLRLATALAEFWELHSHFKEGRRWLEIALEKRNSAAPPVRARLLLNAGWFWGLRLSDRMALLQESEALYRQLDDKRGVAGCLSALGFYAQSEGELDVATSLLSEGLTLARQFDDKQLLTGLYHGLAYVALKRVTLSR